MARISARGSRRLTLCAMKRLLALLALLAWTPAFAGGPITVGPGLGPYNVDSIAGLYNGSTLGQFGDLLYSAPTLKNVTIYSDDLGPNSSSGANAGWFVNSSGNTLTWADSTAVFQPVTYTNVTTNVGKLTCTNGGTACSAGGSDYRQIVNKTLTGVPTVVSSTWTFTVYMQWASGVGIPQLCMARYNDSEKTCAATCVVNATSWTRCQMSITWSSSVYADNSEMRVYIQPMSTTGLYVFGAQLEQNTGPTPYEEMDSHGGRGAWMYSAASYSGGGPPSFSQSAGFPPEPEIWGQAIAVGNTAGNPNGGIAPDGTFFGPNAELTTAGGFMRLVQVSGSASAPKLRAQAGSPSGTISGTAGDVIVDTSTPGLWQSTGGTAWSQLGGVGAGGTNNTVAKFTPNGYTLGNSSITDNGTTVSVGESTTINAQTTVSKAVGTGLVGAAEDVLMIDTTSEAAGVGGGFLMEGVYTGTSVTAAAEIKASKTNSTAGDFGFDLIFGTRTNGNGSLSQALKLDSSQNATFAGSVTLPSNAIFTNGTGGIFSSGATSSGNQSLVINSAGTGDIELQSGAGGFTNAGTGGVKIMGGGSSTTAVWSESSAGNQVNAGTLLVKGSTALNASALGAATVAIATPDSGAGNAATSWATGGWTTFGPNTTSTGAALGIGYSTTNDEGVIATVAPNSAWKPMRIIASNFNIEVANNNTTGIQIDASGNLKALDNVTVNAHVITKAQTASLTNATCASTVCTNVAGTVSTTSTAPSITVTTVTGADDLNCSITPIGTAAAPTSIAHTATSLSWTATSSAKYSYVCISTGS